MDINQLYTSIFSKDGQVQTLITCFGMLSLNIPCEYEIKTIFTPRHVIEPG